MSDLEATDKCINRELPMKGKVGFDRLPYEIVKKYLHNPISFNILCIGETGIGKSTLISSLFRTELEDFEPRTHQHPSVSLKQKCYYLREKDVCLRLTIVESVGYGDQINKQDNFEPLVKYIDSQYEKYLHEELKMRRSLESFQDPRIHVCLYFISPTGHRLKASDIICMKLLNKKVNLVPLIAKSDFLLRDEMVAFKSQIKKDLLEEGIELFQMSLDEEVDENGDFHSNLPFAVIGSTDYVVRDGKLLRGRIYPWGCVRIEDNGHSEFSLLRDCLIETSMEDLREETHLKHYENYRRSRLQQLGGGVQVDLGSEWMNALEKEAEEIRKSWLVEEGMLSQTFVQKAVVEEQMLIAAESALNEKYGVMMKQAEEEKRELDHQYELFMKEVEMFKKKKQTKKKA